MAFAATMTDLTFDVQRSIVEKGEAGPEFERFNSTSSQKRPNAPSFRRGDSSKISAPGDRDSSTAFSRVPSIQEEPDVDASPASASLLPSRPKPTEQGGQKLLGKNNSESTAASPTASPSRKSSRGPASTKVQKVQLSVGEGKLTVDAPYKEGPKMEPSTGSGPTIVLSGTEDQINKALRTLRYTAPRA